MAELPRATLNGSTLTVGDPQTVPQGTYKTRVSSGSKFAWVYQNNTTSNTFIGVVPGQYWFELPSSITNRNTTQIKPYTQSVLSATLEAPVLNVDDSYSLRDISEFRTEVANVSITGNHTWVDENTLSLDPNSIIQFAPKTGWAAQLEDDGSLTTLNAGQNYTVMGPSTVRLVTLQFGSQDGSVEVWSGDMSTSGGDAFAYSGGYIWGGWETVEEWDGPRGGAVRIRRRSANIETGESEGYYVSRVLPWNEDGEWSGVGPVSDGEYVGMTLEEAQTVFNEQQAERIAYDEEEGARELDAAELARVDTVVGTQSLAKGKYDPDPGAAVKYDIVYTGKGKYTIKNMSQNGLAVAVFSASNDEAAIKAAGPKIRSYHNEQYNPPNPYQGGSMWVVALSVVGVAAVIGLIVWVRMKEA